MDILKPSKAVGCSPMSTTSNAHGSKPNATALKADTFSSIQTQIINPDILTCSQMSIEKDGKINKISTSSFFDLFK
jgi:hypothetical protein